MFFFLVSVTGTLLGWKKHSGGTILPPTFQGTTDNLKNWLPLDSLHVIACNVLRDSVSPDLSTETERIDVRKDKGSVKFVFTDNYMGIQLDGATGRLLHIDKRRSDFIENVHDGSIVDRYLNTGGIFKLFYTSVMGFALLIFTVTGFWLWYGPKRMRSRARG